MEFFRVGHISNNKSSQFAVYSFVISIFEQLRGNRVGGNRAEAACASHSSGQAVNYIPCQPTGVREVDVIDTLGPTTFSF